MGARAALVDAAEGASALPDLHLENTTTMRHSHLAFLGLALSGARGPCHARASVVLAVDASSLSSTIASEIAGAGLATDSELSSAVSGLALASDLTALDGRVSTAESTLTTHGTDIAAKAAASDLTALDTNMKAAAGKAFAVAPESFTGSGGTDKFGAAWSMPYSLAAGDYELDADFTMVNGTTQLGVVSARGWKGRYDPTANASAGGWTTLAPATVSLKLETGTVDPSGFFGSNANLPGIDVSADSAVLSTVCRPRNGQTLSVAVDGRLRSLGVNTVS